MDILSALFAPRFMPHGHCYFWDPAMLWLQVGSNLTIGLSYVAISITLFVLARRMRPLPFQRAYVAFGIFIVSCGFTHFMHIVTVWRGVYWLDVGVRVVTALASAATAIWLFPLFPRVVAFGKLATAEREVSRAALEAELARSVALQRELETREAHFRDLVEHLPDLAWSARADGYIEFYNRRWYEYTGTTLEAMQGWGWGTVHHPDHLVTVEALWKASIESGTPFEMEFPLKGVDGTFRWFLTRVRSLRDAEGRVTRWIGTNTDIDDQRRGQVALERAVSIRDEFIAIAAHELRTPLASLLMQLDLARRYVNKGEEPAKVVARIDKVHQSVNRVTTLVESMLDVTRLSVARPALSPTVFDVASLLRELGTDAQLGGVTITYAGPASAMVTWDHERIEQVLRNLLANALKYGNRQPVELVLAVDREEVVIDVIDHGIGIPAEDQQRIFGRFERAVSPRNYGGLGLGLYLSAEIVSSHGGTIEVESTPGAGSRFRVRLPASVA